MPSIRARIFNLVVRLIVKRRDWGKDEYALARRARRIFGAPKISQWLAARAVNISQVDQDGIRGEWLRSKRCDDSATIMYIHGGGYVACSRRTHRPITAAMARMTRLPVLAVDYRLAPENRFPSAIDDVYAAYKWLAAHNSGKPIVLAGDSAGGGLTLALTHKLRESGGQIPACIVCFSPWTDLTGSGTSERTNAEKDAMFYPENIRDFAAAYISKPDDKNDIFASPVFADAAGLPPVLFQVGSTEVLADDSRRIHEKIVAAEGESRLEVFDGVSHVWQMTIGFIPEARKALQNTADFIREHIRPSRPLNM
jgi:acetyl esterase/lipase